VDKSTQRRLQGQFRPLVAKAWQVHCTQLALDTKDGAAYNAWYREILHDCAGIRSTREADQEQMELLISVFEDLTGRRHVVNLEWCVPRQQSFSDAQQEQFAKLVVRAWRKVAPSGTDPQDSAAFLQWLAGVLSAIPSSRNARQAFEGMMARFAVIAQDEYWLDHCARASEIRMRYQVVRKLAELSRLSHRDLGWAYVQGCLDQAKLGTSVEDCPAEHLRAVLAMLSIACKRVLKEAAEAALTAKKKEE
jgi:hypothetical protein